MTEIRTSSDLTVELIDHMGSDSGVIRAMMISTKAEASKDVAETMDIEELQGKIAFLMKNRHGTPFEHNAFTFFVKAPIAVFREWHRHRIGFSYNEESGRYKQLEPEFYIPPPHRPLVQVGKPGNYTFERGTDVQYNALVLEMEAQFTRAYRSYELLLNNGIAKEVARGVLPVYLYSSQYVTLNARSLMAFLSLRTRYQGATYPSFPMWEIEECGHKMDSVFIQHMPSTRHAFRTFGSVCP